MDYISSLPPEILAIILQKFAVADLLPMRRVSKWTRSIIDSLRIRVHADLSDPSNLPLSCSTYYTSVSRVPHDFNNDYLYAMIRIPLNFQHICRADLNALVRQRIPFKYPVISYHFEHYHLHEKDVNSGFLEKLVEWRARVCD